jgi:23S rRNA (cytidine1920-2'-O)/16S rRNA (cytidine1409-2'-O)-methyltransferase
VRAVTAGQVHVGGAVAERASRLVAPGEPVTVVGPPARYVSRGGEKLEAALARFTLDVSGKRALDAGASTGGFTDCLLQHGAAEVVAVDVGKAQLHEKLTGDPRVDSRPGVNVRHLRVEDVGDPFPVIVADLSFISLCTVVPVLLGELAAPGADAVFLVKPQFEAGRAEAARGRGVIRDPAVWRRVLEEVSGAVVATGATIMGAMRSPLTGADGNVEFLVHVHAHQAGGTGISNWAEITDEPTPASCPREA